MSTTLPPRHLLLAVLAVFIWGTNFVVIKVALHALPPLLFAALRFTLASLPFLMWLPRPKTAWRLIAAAGLFIGVGQFGLLFIAMRADISPGLASLLIQTQVFFTLVLAAVLMHERVRVWQIAGLTIAACGIAVIGFHVDASTTPLGIALVLGAALCWALGNVATKRAGAVDMVAFTIWSSAFAVVPLYLLSFLIEGPAAMAAGLAHADLTVWGAVAWQALGNTIVGYGIWNWLLARHAAGVVTPMALLVPVFGMGASALWLGEPLLAWKLVAAGLVLAGIAVAILWPRLRPLRAAEQR